MCDMGFTSSTLSRPGATGGIAVVNSKDAGKAIGHRSLPDGVMTEMEVRISMRLIDAGQLDAETAGAAQRNATHK